MLLQIELHENFAEAGLLWKILDEMIQQWLDFGRIAFGFENLLLEYLNAKVLGMLVGIPIKHQERTIGIVMCQSISGQNNDCL